MAYTRTVWKNGQAPALNEDNLNNIENGIYDITNAAVRYDAAQSLTAVQQHTAQKNIGMTWQCNPNLLDNWYFGNPVNQRGQRSEERRVGKECRL